ncbi:MAG: hypothetical protein GY864_07710, partial [Desulfobacterales bacterium]|nr:hypothetical protein [Desulfobacterales bacterium]
MNKRLIILYWMLLLIPTIVISISVFHLLGHEQERINHAARSSAMERASSIAETLQVTIDAVEDELTETMFQIPAANLERTLLKWEESNPLVRNIFIWKPEGGLQYPLSGTAATNEERRFVARYMALFSGRIPWNSFSDNAQNDDSMQSSYQAQSKREPPDLVQEIRKLKTGRKKLVSMAKGDSINISESSAKMPTVKKSGWIPWFEENRLYILGWVQPDQNRPVYGVELELMALLSRLIVDFPTFTPRGMVFALIDGDGQNLHQDGKSVIESSITHEFSVSLAPHLP